MGNPLALASALEKLEHGASRLPMKAHEATAHMFIVNPLKGKGTALLGKLFSTHPPMSERVMRLRNLKL